MILYILIQKFQRTYQISGKMFKNLDLKVIPWEACRTDYLGTSKKECENNHKIDFKI